MESKGGSTSIIIGILALVAMAFVVILSLFFTGSGPGPRGAQAAEPINITDPAVLDLSNKFSVFSDPEKVLSANAASLSELKAALTKVREGINTKQSGFSNLSPDVTTKIDGLIQKIDQLTLLSTSATDKQKRADLAKGIVEDIKFLNGLIAGSINCQGGGTCLDVPVVIQGQGGYCGRTSIAMVLLFYSKGVYSGKGLAGYITKDTNGRFTTAGSAGNNLSPATLNAGTPHKDWVYAEKGSSPDAYYDAIKKSISAGDPVILYTYGAFFAASSNHIVAAVGFNDSNKTIYVNNPLTLGDGGTKKATNRGDDQALLTADFLYKHAGENYSGYNGHSLLIRQVYKPK